MNIKQLKTHSINRRLEKPMLSQKHEFLDKNKKSLTKKKIQVFITSTPFSVFMSFLTIYTIFAIDIDKAFFTVQASFWFSVIHLFSMAIFISETIFMIISQQNYLFSFYFWIDIFSTLTMIIQVIWIEDLMNSVQNLQMAISIARISKASRFSKIGARSTKIMKLIRLIKLMKIMNNKDKVQNEIENKQLVDNEHSQTYKESNQPQNDFYGKYKSKQNIGCPNKSLFLERPNVDIERQIQIQKQWEQVKMKFKENDKKEPQQSQNIQNTKVGKILKDEIQRNIVIMVMGVIIFVPLLSADTWFTKTVQLSFVADIYMNQIVKTAQGTQKDQILINFVDISQDAACPLVYLRLNLNQSKDFQYNQASQQIKLQDLRQSDKSVIQDQKFKIVYNKIFLNRIISIINMFRSLFVTLLLIIASILFIRDIDNFALIPLEKMIDTVYKIENNPYGVFMSKIQRLIEIQNGQIQQNSQNKTSKLNQQLQKEQIYLDILPNHLPEQLETNLLQKLILKICYLLSIGIGQLACKLTDQNSVQVQSVANLDKIVSIYGCFLCIRLAHLKEIIKLMGQQSVNYINIVLQIVHKCAIRFGGVILEQEGTQFIVAWQNYAQQCHKSKNHDEFINGGTTKKLANLSFITLVEIFRQLQNNEALLQYESILNNIKDYKRLKIHTSVVFGTANFGAIGSEFKINLKIIGNDIAIARKLCQLAEQNKAACIANQFFIKICQFSKYFARKIDEVYYQPCTSDEDEQQVEQIYTFDLILQKDKQNHKQISSDDSSLREQIIYYFQQRDKNLRKLKKNKFQQISQEQYIIQKYTSASYCEWIEFWQQAMLAYQNYQWRKATSSFELVQERMGEILNLFPGSPDIFSDIKLSTIKKWKYSQSTFTFANEIDLKF